MANQKISQLTNSPAASGDLIPVDRSGANFSVSVQSIATLTAPIERSIHMPLITLPATGSAGNTFIASNNQVRYVAVVVPYPVTISTVAIIIGTKGAGAATADVGIYSADGTVRLINTAGIDVGSGQTNATAKTAAIAQTSVTLQPGAYVFAYTCSDAAVQLGLVTTLTLATLLLNTQATKGYGTAGNAATAGVLPTTLGTLTTANASNNAVAAYLFS